MVKRDRDGERARQALSFLQMPDRINLADPSFEPSDAQLAELSRLAFAGVAEARRVALAKLRAQIAVESRRVMQALDERSKAPRTAT